MGNPETITGARGPAEERSSLVQQKLAERRTGAVEIPENEVWYQARFTRYRVQLTAPQDNRLPDGRILRTNPLVAQFDNAMLRLKKDKEKDAKKIELLEEHPSLGRDFWHFADVLEQQKTQEREQAVDVLADPDQRKLIIEALKAEGGDFELPKSSSRKAKGKVEADESAE
jgi:hypothetical protein